MSNEVFGIIASTLAICCCIGSGCLNRKLGNIIYVSVLGFSNLVFIIVHIANL